MHELIKQDLEGYLLGKLGEGRLREFELHLDGCADCCDEVEQMQAQSLLLKGLRAPAGIEPAAGFYGRVMNSIEAQAKPSIWSVFLDPIFGKRLMYATMTLLVLLGTYLVTTQTEPQTYAEAATTTPEKILVEQQPAVGGDQQRDRDVILVNLATYRE